MAVNIDIITTNILKYIYKRYDSYKSSMRIVPNGSFEVVDFGDEVEGDIFSGASIIYDGLKQRCDIAFFPTSKHWLAWQKRNVKSSESVGFVIVVDNNADVEQYSIKEIYCIEVTIPEQLFEKVVTLVTSNGAYCVDYIVKLDDFIKYDILSSFAIERLENKYNHIYNAHGIHGKEWNRSLVYTIFDSIYIANKRNRRSMNILVSKIAYGDMINVLPDLFSCEALLFGASGILSMSMLNDDYAMQLAKRFAELRKQFGIQPMTPTAWDFSYRGADNSLQLTISQIASILYNNKNFFLKLAETPSIENFRGFLTAKVSPYFMNHDGFDNLCNCKYQSDRFLTKLKQDRVIINGIVPLLLAYHKEVEDYEKSDTLIDILENLDAEDNFIITKWKKSGMKIKNAFVSQAIIEIDKKYCFYGLCTECRIGRMMIGKIGK